MWQKNIDWKYFAVSLAFVCTFFEITAAQGLQCFVCSSDNLEACSVTNPDSDVELPFENCSSDVASCFVKIENGVSRRGCLSHEHDQQTICDDTNCIKCYSDKCNGHSNDIDLNMFEEISNENDETPNHITCVSCDSATDPTCGQNTTFEVFENCDLPNKCYHYIGKFGEHKRGCTKGIADTKLLELCKLNGDKCKTCVGSNCNSESSFKKCLTCSTENDQNCAKDPHLVAGTICETYGDECYTHIGRSHVERGCMQDKTVIFGIECRIDPDKCESCTTHEGNGCNNQTIYIDTCVDCDSTKGMNCHDDPSSYKGKICTGFIKNLQMGCYLNVENDEYKRGCVSDLNSNKKSECESQSETCKTCFPKDCNKKIEFQKCIECNSKNDISCAGNVSIDKSVTCKHYVNSCITGIDGDGHTIRRCRNDSDYEHDNFPYFQFEVCSGNNCNKDIYPPNRLRCYQCNGEDDCDFMSMNSTETLQPEPCGILSKFEQCYAYLGEDNKIYRGCWADSSEHRRLCDQEGGKGICMKCDKSGCNDMPRVKSASLSCIKCDKTEECAFGHDEDKVTPCHSEIPFGLIESCYTHHNADEGWVQRGCTLDDEKIESENTKICTDPACNVENTRHSYCITCEGRFGGECASISDTNAFLKQCDGVYPYEKRGCYTMVKNNTIHRGCVKDLDESEISTFEIERLNNVCREDGCNTNDVKRHQICYECDAKTDPNCVGRLEDSMKTECPETEEDFGCFHSITESSVVRGCVAKLDDQQREQCLSNGDTCKTCTGNDCNKKRSFSECIKTNGFVNILHKPKEPTDKKISTKICKDYNDSCFTLVNDPNTVIRDCLNEYIENTDNSTDFLTKKYSKSSYKVCSEPLCNDELINEIHCYSCDSRYDANCSNTTLVEKKRCALEVNPSGCYHFDDGNYVKRGCVNDLDAEEQSECKSDSDTCKHCIKTDCNSKVSFQNCISFEPETNSTNSKLCKRYTDECFIHVSGNITRRGCISDLIESPVKGIDIIKDCKDPLVCEKCSKTNNCNDREISTEKCIVCSSLKDLYCSFYPDIEMSEKCPLALKTIGCFLWTDGAMRSRRGCMSHLNQTIQQSCTEPSETCKSCTGENCNIKRNFQSCVVCNSWKDGQNCIDQAFTLETSTCANYNDSCYTVVEHGAVFRNCTGDDRVPDVDSCKSNPEKCKVCSDSRQCNDRTIKPLTCVSCTSKTDPHCATNETFSAFETCPLSINSQSCYHLIKDDGEIIRGCTEQLEQKTKEVCKENGETCKTCSESNCNSRISFEKCYACNSTIDVNCIANPQPKSIKTCKSYDDICYTHIGKYNVDRGCLGEQHYLFQSECKQHRDKCMTCSTKNGVRCNKDAIPMEKCVECDSLKNATCANNPDKFEDKICTQFVRWSLTSEIEGCYINRVNNQTIRGCVRDLSPSKKSQCLRQTDECKTCFGKNCNTKKSFQKCYHSEGQYPLSSSMPNEVSVKTCTHINDACFVLIKGESVIKDCLSDYTEKHNLTINFLAETYNSSQYSVCSTELCNNQEIKETNCIKCDSRNHLNCKGPFTLAWREYWFNKCPLEVYSSGCYHYEGNHTERGCVANLVDEKHKLCDTDTDICKHCIGNECNDRLSYQKCITNSEHEANVTQSKVCKRYLDECFVHASGNKIQRGCTSDLVELPGNDLDLIEEKKNHRYASCSYSDNCNNINVENEYCLDCRDNTNCTYYPDFDMTRRCPMTLENLGCYLNNINGSSVERGCMSQLDHEQRTICKNGKDQCKMCMGDDCNVKRTFQKCHICDSENGNDEEKENCMKSPWNAEEIECPNYMNSCYTVVNDGKVKRGCIGDDTVIVEDHCKRNPDTCFACSDKQSCNDIVLKKETCVSCDSSIDESCATNTTFTTFDECPILIYPNACYHSINQTTGVHKRGCVKKLDESMLLDCQKNGDECKTCAGSNCNSESSFKSCVHCSPTEDPLCATDPSASFTKMCKQYNDQCFTSIGRIGVTRGCLNERSQEFIGMCKANVDKCETCTTQDDQECNKKPVALDICVECSSENGDDCSNKPDLYRNKICSGIDSTKAEGCFLHTAGDFVNRGCVRDLTGHLKRFCLDQMDTCKTCVGPNCNSMKEFRQCYATNGEVSSLPDNWKENTKVCKKYNDKCFSFVSENATIVKDCLSEYTEKKNIPLDFYTKYNTSTYKECDSTLCNDEHIEPLWCVGCDSESDKNCYATAFATRVKCALEVIPSGCYHHHNGTRTKRGCVTDLYDEDRKSCESDTDECKKCIGRECNWKPEFQTCLASNVKNLTETKICRRYDDQCFTHVANEVVKRGCISDITESVIEGIKLTDCDDADICEKCSQSDNCNNREIKPEVCVVCSTKDNNDLCAHFPVNMTQECPLAVKPLGCYLHRVERIAKKRDQYYERGCVAELNSVKRAYCREGNDACKVCIGDKCNEKRNFQKCFSCNSLVDGKYCQQRPSLMPNNQSTLCVNYLDNCYTLVKDNVVVRNCTGDTKIPHEVDCERNKEHCELCNDQYDCNNQEIKPTICISCNSTVDPMCATNTTFTTFETCPLDIHPPKCYHYINPTTGEHTRGCLKSLPEDMMKQCEKNGDECKTCTQSKCNDQLSFKRCLRCSTKEDPQCAINPQYSESRICPNYNDICFTFIGDFEVSRGCMGDNTIEFKKQCQRNPDKCAECVAGEGNGCNNQTLTMETCVECDSRVENCHDDPHSYKGKVCSGIRTKDRLGCYLRVNGDHYERGCLRDLSPIQKTFCEKQSDTCKSCVGKDCNLKKEFQECIHCNSMDDFECAHNASSKLSIVCIDYLSGCLTGIDAHGHTHRRCGRGSEEESIEFPNNRIDVCSPNKCNTGIFPENRLHCHRCEGEEECDFMSSNSTALVPAQTPKLVPCSIYTTMDQCFAYRGEDQKIYRGCLTDTSEHRLLCDAPNAGDICIKCGSSGCNDVPRVKPPSLQCVHCDKSLDCAFGQNSNKASLCVNDVPFGYEETCYTRFGFDNGGWAERGCSIDVKKSLTSLEESEHEKLCNHDGCNNDNVIHSYCVSCESGLDGNCVTISDPESFIEQCKGTYSIETRGCYTMVKNETVVRGCTKDLSTADLDICKQDENEQCTLCLNDNCNIHTAASSRIVFANSLLILTMISVILMSK